MDAAREPFFSFNSFNYGLMVAHNLTKFTLALIYKKEYYFLGNNAVYSVETQTIWLATCFHADILLGIFDPQDGIVMFLQNVC
jgi:hypothetical protein